MPPAWVISLFPYGRWADKPRHRTPRRGRPSSTTSPCRHRSLHRPLPRSARYQTRSIHDSCSLPPSAAPLNLLLSALTARGSHHLAPARRSSSSPLGMHLLTSEVETHPPTVGCRIRAVLGRFPSWSGTTGPPVAHWWH